VVLLVLAIIWAALLTSWFRSRSGGTLSDSVGSFRRHLTVLEKATPSTVRPANRLRDVRPARYPSREARAALIARSGVPVRSDGTVAGSALPSGYAVRRPVSSQQMIVRRRQAQRRRRDVFFALLVGVAGSLALALVPGLSIMWAVQVIFDLLLTGYVTVLLRLRNRVVERDLKLRFLPAAQRLTPDGHQYGFASARPGHLELRHLAN
jgi:hypothetical protein